MSYKQTAVRLRHYAARLRTAIAPLPPLVFEKMFFFGGLGSIAFGMYLIYKPLGYIAGGLMGIWLATLISGERHQ